MKKSGMTTHINKKHKESLTKTEKIAKFITDKIGTFGCFVFFAALTCISLPAVIQADSVILWIQWITQSFLQLVLLPLILVASNIQSRHSEYLAEATYENDIEMHKDIDIIKSLLTK